MSIVGARPPLLPFGAGPSQEYCKYSHPGRRSLQMRHTIGCPDAAKNLGGCLISSWTEDSENEVIYMVLVNLPSGSMIKIMCLVFAYFPAHLLRCGDQIYCCSWFCNDLALKHT